MLSSHSFKVVLVTTLLVLYSDADSCSIIKKYLGLVNKALKTDKSEAAYKSIPRESADNNELVICSAENTCCTPDSELAMQEGATDFFIAYSISLGIGRIEDEITKLKARVSNDIESIVRRTDGVIVAESVTRYLSGESDSVDDIISKQLLYFIQQIYNSTLTGECLERFDKTEAMLLERNEALLDQYQRFLNALSDGIKRLQSLKQEIIDAISPECISSVSKASLYEGVGCKMCKDATKPVNTCYNLCLNVLRGCLRPLLCYEPEWNQWAQKQESISLELKKLAEDRPSFLSQIVSQFEMEYNELSDVDADACPIDISLRNGDRLAQLAKADTSISAAYFERMSQLGSELSDLPAQVCRTSSFLSPPDTSENCWNGTHVATYDADTPNFDLEDQKCNPEVSAVRLNCDIGSMTCDSYKVGTELPTQVVTGAVKNASSRMTTAPLSLMACLLLSFVLRQ